MVVSGWTALSATARCSASSSLGAERRRSSRCGWSPRRRCPPLLHRPPTKPDDRWSASCCSGSSSASGSGRGCAVRAAGRRRAARPRGRRSPAVARPAAALGRRPVPRPLARGRADRADGAVVRLWCCSRWSSPWRSAARDPAAGHAGSAAFAYRSRVRQPRRPPLRRREPLTTPAECHRHGRPDRPGRARRRRRRAAGPARPAGLAGRCGPTGTAGELLRRHLLWALVGAAAASAGWWSAASGRAGSTRRTARA